MAKGQNPKKKEQEVVRQIQNRRAGYDYELFDRYEAGIALVGAEVKSVFLGKAHLTDAYCRVANGEIFLINADIEPYEYSTTDIPERRKDRKLLMHRKEIELIDRRAREKGLTIVPLKLYFKGRKVKVEIALARGKRKYDKREKIDREETRREAQRETRRVK